jgi:hypothetical protein
MDYKNGKIYKITDIAYTKMYIGSTCQPLSKRFTNHKGHYKLWKDGKSHKISSYDLFDEFGIENCKIELIENFACNCKDELQKKEGEHIKNNDCVNKVISGRTKKEYYIDNKDKMKEYREANKDKMKEYYEANKEKISEKKKEYNEANKEKISEKKKEYQQANKEKISEYQKKYQKEYYAKKKAAMAEL